MGLGGVRVLDADGNPVQDGAARADGEVVEVDLQPDLPDGTYVVSYRVVSADGHPVRGGSVFGVGEGEVDTGALGRVDGDADDRSWEVVGAVGRALAYAGDPGRRRRHRVPRPRAPRRRRARRPRRGRARRRGGGRGRRRSWPCRCRPPSGTGQGPGSLFDDGVLAEVAEDGVGLGVLLALVGVVVAVAALRRVAGRWRWRARRSPPAPSPPTGTPARVRTSRWRPSPTSRTSGSWRCGEAGSSCCGAPSAPDASDGDRADTVGLVGRFSTLATAMVVLVGVTGGVLGWQEVGSLDALTSTGYGQLLLAKVAVVVVVAALGAYNHFRLVPALGRGKAAAALAQLWTTVRLEVLPLGRRRRHHRRCWWW